MCCDGKTRVVTAITVLWFLSIFFYSLSGTAHAYSTGYRWPQGTSGIYFSVAPSLANSIGLSGQQAAVEQAIQNAAAEWSKAARLSIVYNSGASYSVTANWLSSTFLGITYYGTSGSTLQSVRTEMTTNSAWMPWHLNATQPDVYKVMLHEFGHWLTLLDHPQNMWDGAYGAVMWYGAEKSALYIDDKEGATNMYGIWSKFEVSQYVGLYQVPPTYSIGVASFGNCGTGAPDYWTYNVSSEGIPSSPSGGRVMRFRGCATSNGSTPNYAYLPLASYERDSNGEDTSGPRSPCGSPCWMKITSGTHLRWEQYNATKCTVTFDLEFTDGSSLRDSGLYDSAGRSVHPTNRTCVVTPQGSWYSVDIDLSPLAGKTIKRWLLVYDTPLDSGTWRSYFDNVRVTY